MELEYYNSFIGDHLKFNLSEILDEISDFGDGPLEFQTSKIESMVKKIQQLEAENKELKEWIPVSERLPEKRGG